MLSAVRCVCVCYLKSECLEVCRDCHPACDAVYITEGYRLSPTQRSVSLEAGSDSCGAAEGWGLLGCDFMSVVG